MIPEPIEKFLSASRVYLGLQSQPSRTRRGRQPQGRPAMCARPFSPPRSSPSKEVPHHEFPT